MPTLETSINAAISDFDTIKAAIAANGVEVPDGTPTREYGNLVNRVASGAGKEDLANKVTSISAESTDIQYPSAKCVYDELSTKANIPIVTVTQLDNEFVGMGRINLYELNTVLEGLGLQTYENLDNGYGLVISNIDDGILLHQKIVFGQSEICRNGYCDSWSNWEIKGVSSYLSDWELINTMTITQDNTTTVFEWNAMTDGYAMKCREVFVKLNGVKTTSASEGILYIGGNSHSVGGSRFYINSFSPSSTAISESIFVYNIHKNMFCQAFKRSNTLQTSDNLYGAQYPQQEGFADFIDKLSITFASAPVSGTIAVYGRSIIA